MTTPAPVSASKVAALGGGEGANMCGIAPDATLYGVPC